MTKAKSLKQTGFNGAIAAFAVAGLMAFPGQQFEKPPREYPGPYLADVVQQVDADTPKLQVHIWPDQTVRVGFRINGVDTPEKGWRGKCEKEKALAEQASNFVAAKIPVGTRVRVSNVIIGKYGRRAVGDLEFDDLEGIEDLGQSLVRHNYAVPYFGGTKKKDWCAE